jgi:hypothetical protein
MAQEQVACNEGLGEIGLLVTGGTATAIQRICCIKNACSAATASGLSNYTQSTDAGLTEVSADTVSASSDSCVNDTACISHPFTASGDATVLGFQVINVDSDVLYAVCCFASSVIMAQDDTLTCTLKARFKNG